MAKVLRTTSVSGKTVYVLKTTLFRFAQGEQHSGQEKSSGGAWAFLVCFLIALLFWTLTVLSRNYNNLVTFPVVYTHFPPGEVLLNQLPGTISIEINARGFDLLAWQFNLKRKKIVINVGKYRDAGTAHGNNEWTIPSSILLADVLKQLGGEVKLTSIVPSRISFLVGKKYLRKLPVIPDISLHFEKPFGLSGAILAVPDSVLVSGPEYELRNLTHITTEKLSLQGVKQTILQKVSVKIPGQTAVSFYPAGIQLRIPVEKFTEKEIELPIEIVNNNALHTLKIFPEKIKVKTRIPLSKYNNVSANNFRVVADFGNLPADAPPRIDVELSMKPSYTQIISVTPSRVNYIIQQ